MDDSDLLALERLAALELEPAERARLRRQLDVLREWIACLEEIEPADPAKALGAAAPDAWRDDEPLAPLDPERALANAPARADGFFEVPRVLEHGA